MGRKLLCFSLLIGAILFCPWPVTLVVTIVVAVILGSMTTALVSALSFDWLYNTSDHLALGSITVVAVFLIVRLGQQFVRFNS